MKERVMSPGTRKPGVEGEHQWVAGPVVDDGGHRLLLLRVGVPGQMLAQVFQAFHPPPDLLQVHGEDRGRLPHFFPLHRKMDGNEEGVAPVEQAGGSPVVPYEGEPSDPVTLRRLGGEVEVGLSSEPSQQSFLDLRKLGPLPLPAVHRSPFQAGLEAMGPAAVSAKAPLAGLELLVAFQELLPVAHGL